MDADGEMVHRVDLTRGGAGNLLCTCATANEMVFIEDARSDSRFAKGQDDPPGETNGRELRLSYS
jgi:hypothetical protein